MNEKKLRIVDCDAHVEECEETFSEQFFDSNFADRRPHMVLEGDYPQWAMGDERHSQLTGRGAYNVGPFTYKGKRMRSEYGTSGDDLASAEMRRTDLRVKEMLAENIEHSVIFPTLFLKWPLVEDVDYGVAICQSYNNWMSYRCAEQEGLEWVSTVPLAIDTVDVAIEEMLRAKSIGAVGVMILGLVGDHMLHEAPLKPFFAAAAKHNISVNIHVGFPSPGMANVCDNMDFHFIGPFGTSVHMGFLAIVMGGVLDEFPTLKVSFLEAGCDWVPYMLGRMEERFTMKPKSGRAVYGSERHPMEIVNDGNVFIHAEIIDKTIPLVLDMVGPDVLVFASDIPHAHRHPNAGALLYQRADIEKDMVTKILWDNPARLFDLDV
ncbi:MAG: hypothetical protein DRR42_13715 [Gammaproteobacteria bacterium]|nr:MAG: hypothetical protein DRR42_13715 [Gammaproteobacteria bacterium]